MTPTLALQLHLSLSFRSKQRLLLTLRHNWWSARHRQHTSATVAAPSATPAPTAPATEKRCSCCKLNKPTSDFAPHSTAADGLQHWCLVCAQEDATARGRRPFQAPIVAVTEKRCPRCELTKPAAQFNYSWQTSDRLQCYCKECKREVHNLRMAEARKREATPKVAQKQCRHCLQVLPASSFCISRRIADGLNSYCRKCNYEFAHKRSIKRRWPVTQPTVSEKRCTRCAVVKPAGMFSRRTAQRDGLQAYCKGCMREVSQVSLSKRAAASSKSTNAGQ